jgi:hypothetical protein
MPKEILTKIEHKPLHCPICGTRFMNVFGQPLPMHAQIRCITTAGNEMDLGICEKCIEGGISINTCNAILEGIKDFWVAELEANKAMSEKQKKQKIEYHNSHIISEVQKVIMTGKEAENTARKKGQLR